MWGWINENGSGLSLVVNVGMLCIWIAYLQLFLFAFLRQRRANILINRGAGHAEDARCLVTNMSSEPVYIQNILATVSSGNEKYTLAVTDFETGDEPDTASAFSNVSSQGPLHTGQMMDIGTFRTLIGRTLRHHGVESGRIDDMTQQFDSLDLMVIGAYGPTSHGVAAKRSFRLQKEEGRSLVPTTLDTEQIISGRERRQVRKSLERNL